LEAFSVFLSEFFSIDQYPTARERANFDCDLRFGVIPMPTSYLPSVTATDHEALRRMVDNYPADTYEKWRFLQTKEIANWRKSGWDVVLIDVTADDFVRYCKETGASPNFHTFRGIASAKAIGKFG
jgi:hypothetical protein